MEDKPKKFSVGIVGLGVMSQNLCCNLLKKGFSVALYNRTFQKALVFCEEIVAGKCFVDDDFSDLKALSDKIEEYFKKLDDSKNQKDSVENRNAKDKKLDDENRADLTKNACNQIHVTNDEYTISTDSRKDMTSTKNQNTQAKTDRVINDDNTLTIHPKIQTKTNKNIFKANPHNIKAFESYEDFINSLREPRKIILLLPSGDPIDNTLKELSQFISNNDVVMDFGNSYYQDTNRRAKNHNFHFMGVGISGGSSGALKGPSLMVGGTQEAYEIVRNLLESIAAEHREAVVTELYEIESEKAENATKSENNSSVEFTSLSQKTEKGINKDLSGNSIDSSLNTEIKTTCNSSANLTKSSNKNKKPANQKNRKKKSKEQISNPKKSPAIKNPISVSINPETNEKNNSDDEAIENFKDYEKYEEDPKRIDSYTLNIYKCVDLLGPPEAGHFVKMVHNAIEYAEMSLLAELRSVVYILTRFEKCKICSHRLFRDYDAINLLFKTKKCPHYYIDKNIRRTFEAHLEICCGKIDSDKYAIRMLEKIFCLKPVYNPFTGIGGSEKWGNLSQNALNPEPFIVDSEKIQLVNPYLHRPVNPLTEHREVTERRKKVNLIYHNFQDSDSNQPEEHAKGHSKNSKNIHESSDASEPIHKSNKCSTTALHPISSSHLNSSISKNNLKKYSTSTQNSMSGDVSSLLSVENFETDSENSTEKDNSSIPVMDQIKALLSRKASRSSKFIEIVDGYLPKAILKICKAKINDRYILPLVDTAIKNKGTGLWAVKTAMDYGIPITLTTAALYDRLMSNKPILKTNLKVKKYAQPIVEILSETMKCDMELRFFVWFNNQRKKSIYGDKEILYDEKIHKIDKPKIILNTEKNTKKRKKYTVNETIQEIRRRKYESENKQPNEAIELNNSINGSVEIKQESKNEQPTEIVNTDDSLENDINLHNYSINYITLRHAINLARAINYCQNLELIKQVSIKNNWDIDLVRVIKIWKKGTIIQSSFLDEVEHYAKKGLLEESEEFVGRYMKSINYLRKLVTFSTESDLPIPCFSSALNYIDAITTENPTGNVIQALRDCFGAHEVKLIGEDSYRHLDWEKMAKPLERWDHSLD